MEADDLDELREAKRILENPGLTARLAGFLGIPLERGLQLLPAGWQRVIQASTEKAIHGALKLAVRTLKEGRVGSSSDWLHKGGVVLSGALGGAFGFSALAVELPTSTTIMLRSIADVARSYGESVRAPETQLACVEVFALGGRTRADDAGESAYFAARIAMAKVITEAAEYVAIKGLVEEGAPVLLRLIAGIAARFAVPVTEKVAAQAIPIVGAGGGALVNYLFIDHFQDMARGHFAVRRLERKYGPDVVRDHYDRL